MQTILKYSLAVPSQQLPTRFSMLHYKMNFNPNSLSYQGHNPPFHCKTCQWRYVSLHANSEKKTIIETLKHVLITTQTWEMACSYLSNFVNVFASAVLEEFLVKNILQRRIAKKNEHKFVCRQIMSCSSKVLLNKSHIAAVLNAIKLTIHM